MCLPGNAVSILLECFPTFSGKLLAVSRTVCAVWSAVDLILGPSVCGQASCRVASRAFSLASFMSSLSSLVGIYRAMNTFPAFRSMFTEL